MSPLQFTLRWLLLTITLCAAAFAVARWAGPGWPYLLPAFACALALLVNQRVAMRRRLLIGLAVMLLSFLAVQLVILAMDYYGWAPAYF
jgi:hypothetical protein